jgi:hypothetical protein
MTPTVKYTFKYIYDMMPENLKQRYKFSHHEDLNLINMDYNGTHSSYPIADIYNILESEVTFKLMSQKYVVTIFKNADLVITQVF